MANVFGTIFNWCKTHKRELCFAFTAFFLIILYVSKSLKNSNDAYFKIIGYSVLFIAAAFSFFLIYLSRKSNFSLAKIWLITALGFGIIRIFVITPFSVWDEYGHYEISYRYSDFLLFKFKSPHLMDKNHADYSNLEIQNNAKSAFLRYKEPFFLKETEKVNKERIPSTPNPVQYLPQAFGIALGRLLHFNFMPLFFLGRLCNLLFYVFCIWLAIKVIPFGKLVIFACGLLPLTLHQAASLSLDAYILAICFVFFAFLVKSMTDEAPATLKEIIILCVFSILISPSKLIYWPLSLLAFLIPQKRFATKKEWFFSACAVAFSGILSIIAFSLPSLAIQSGGGEAKILYNGEIGWTLSDIIHNPARVINMALWTLRYTWADWISQAFGLIIMGLPQEVPSWCRQAHLFILIISSLVCWASNSEQEVLGKVQKAGVAIVILAVVALAMFGELVIWTPLNANSIDGVQGRYFLPIFPLILFLFRNRIFVTTRNVEKAVFVAEIFLQFYLVFMSVNLTL